MTCANVRQCKSSSMQRFVSAKVRQCKGSSLQRFVSAKVRQCKGPPVQRFVSTQVRQCNGSPVQRGSSVQRFVNAEVRQCKGSSGTSTQGSTVQTLALLGGTLICLKNGKRRTPRIATKIEKGCIEGRGWRIASRRNPPIP